MDAFGGHVRRGNSAIVYQWGAGKQPRADWTDLGFGESVADRWGHYLRAIFSGKHRRGTNLQPGVERSSNRERHEYADLGFNAYAYANANTDPCDHAYSHSHTDSNRDCHRNSHCHSDRDGNTNRDSNGYANSDSVTHTHTDTNRYSNCDADSWSRRSL